MHGRKSNQKSRNSTAKKLQTSKKPINQKDKIVNVIKKSTLITTKNTKNRTSSKTKKTQTEKKNLNNPYQIQSYRHQLVKALSSVSKSMPVKNQKPNKIQFPFEAIKFKEKAKGNIIQSKTYDGFYIQYDEPQQTQIDMSVLNNSKKLLGSYNQRVSRYNQLKSKPKGEFLSDIENVHFKQALIKLFKFLDPHSNTIISHHQINYRKLPQAVLYFLGGLFHRIRQKNMLLSQHQFLQQCGLLYKRSSNEDIKWFIQEVYALPSATQQISLNKKLNSNSQFGIINQECFRKVKIEQKQIVSTKNLPILVQGYNNLSFDHQENGISFRNQAKENEYNTKDSNPSEKESVKSPHFGQFQQRFSFNNRNLQQLNIAEQKNPLKETQNFDVQKSQRNSLSKNQQKQAFTIRAVGIKKNIVDKAEDLRQQIYAKMDKMKLYPQNKENLLLKQNFTSKPIQQFINQKQNSHKISQKQIHSNLSKTLNTKQKKINDSFIPKNKQSIENQTNQQVYFDSKKQPTNKSYVRKPLTQKNTEWVNKVPNCQKAFDQLQKIKQEFKTQKKMFQKRQMPSKSNYTKENSQKNNSLVEDFILEDQTRILKLTEKIRSFQKPLQRQNMKYETNIDRLSILSNSRNQNSKNININESLVNSCRKSLQVRIPSRYEGKKVLSLSEKKSMGYQKVDKIEQLSQKLEKYLKNNAQKIQYSKNFTQAPNTVGYNKILAM